MVHDHASMSHPNEQQDLYDTDNGKIVLSMTLGLERLSILSFKLRIIKYILGLFGFISTCSILSFMNMWMNIQIHN